MAGFLLLIAALPAGLAPRRYWEALDVRLPVSRMAFGSAIATFVASALIGVPAFFKYMDARLGTLSAFAAFTFLFTTPAGLISMYLAFTGWLRFIGWYVEDPWGDPLLTIADAVVRRSWFTHQKNTAKRDRERREGAEVPDVLMTGADLGMPDADLVVIASRRKPEWDAGAIVVTEEKWFKLGQAAEQQMPGGWRTLYPLSEMHHHEVLRRAVPYTLPRLRKPRPRL